MNIYESKPAYLSYHTQFYIYFNFHSTKLFILLHKHNVLWKLKLNVRLSVCVRLGIHVGLDEPTLYVSSKTSLTWVHSRQSWVKIFGEKLEMTDDRLHSHWLSSASMLHTLSFVVIHSFYGNTFLLWYNIIFSLYNVTHCLKVSSVNRPDSRHVWTNDSSWTP